MILIVASNWHNRRTFGGTNWKCCQYSIASVPTFHTVHAGNTCNISGSVLCRYCLLLKVIHRWILECLPRYISVIRFEDNYPEGQSCGILGNEKCLRVKKKKEVTSKPKIVLSKYRLPIPHGYCTKIIQFESGFDVFTSHGKNLVLLYFTFHVTSTVPDIFCIVAWREKVPTQADTHTRQSPIA